MKESGSNTLQKNIGMPQAIALYIGAVLGSGVLIVPGLAAEMAGPASLLAWGFMSLLILPMALSMGLLSAKFPNAGGVSHFVTLAFGPKAGSLVGWFFLMSVPIGAPVAALTGAGYMTAAMGWDESARITIAAIMLVISTDYELDWYAGGWKGTNSGSYSDCCCAGLLLCYCTAPYGSRTLHSLYPTWMDEHW